MKNAAVQQEDRKYELMVIIDPEIGIVSIKKRLDEIRKLLSKEKKGEIFFDEEWGMRDFAYAFKKRDKGYYAVLNFTVDPSLLKEIDKVLRLETEILRHLIVTLPFSYVAKSYAELMTVKEEPKVEKPGSRPMIRKPAEAVAAPAAVKKEDEAPAPKKVIRRKEEVTKENSLEEVDAKLKSIIDNPDINF